MGSVAEARLSEPLAIPLLFSSRAAIIARHEFEHVGPCSLLRGSDSQLSDGRGSWLPQCRLDATYTAGQAIEQLIQAGTGHDGPGWQLLQPVCSHYRPRVRFANQLAASLTLEFGHE